MTTKIQDTPKWIDDDFVEEWFYDTESFFPGTASGYGSNIRTPMQVRCKDGWIRRVYCIQYSNAGSLYIRSRGKSLFFKPHHVPDTASMVEVTAPVTQQHQPKRKKESND